MPRRRRRCGWRSRTAAAKRHPSCWRCAPLRASQPLVPLLHASAAQARVNTEHRVSGLTPLLWCVRACVCRPRREKEARRRPAHRCCVNGRGEAAKQLISASCDLAVRGIDVPGARARAHVGAQAKINDQSALHLAAWNGHAAVIQLLIDAKVRCVPRPARSAIDQHRAQVDIDEQDGNQRTALHSAAEHGHTPAIQTLVKGGADIEVRGQPCPRTPCSPHPARGCARTVQSQAVDNGGHTALHYAVRGAHTTAVQTLLNLGAAVNAADSKDKVCPAARPFAGPPALSRASGRPPCTTRSAPRRTRFPWSRSSSRRRCRIASGRARLTRGRTRRTCARATGAAARRCTCAPSSGGRGSPRCSSSTRRWLASATTTSAPVCTWRRGAGSTISASS
jgi:ankyrin repeat protein